MSTLKVLGLSAIGNYVEGSRDGIVLNKDGAVKFNLWYPTPNSTPNFTPGNQVEINCKLPEQQPGGSTAKVVVKGNNGSVSSLIVMDKDDWFERQTPVSSTPKAK